MVRHRRGTMRLELPEMREVTFLEDWSAFVASGSVGSGLPIASW
jgi:hypothetical protein